MRRLQIGSGGRDTRHLQVLLASQGMHVQSDGLFGPATDRAVRIFQRRSGIYPPDGIVRQDTLDALNATACKVDARSGGAMGRLPVPFPAEKPSFGPPFAVARRETKAGPRTADAQPAVAVGSLAATVDTSKSWAERYPDLLGR